MKINELATVAGLNAETIRKYRDRGLLQPKRNPENGYYEYGQADFLQLLYVRKMRGAHLSLDAIETTCRTGDAETILKGYRAAIRTLEEQIRELRRKEMMLSVTARHYERDARTAQQIRLIEAFDTKYDVYFTADPPDEVLRQCIRNMDLFTMVVCIGRAYFEAEALPPRVPIRIGVGSYEKILKEENFRMPESAAVFPKAKYVCFFLEVEDLQSVEAEKLAPVRAYLRQEGLHAMGDSTAYLYRTDISHGTPRFIFCVRVMVDPLP